MLLVLDMPDLDRYPEVEMLKSQWNPEYRRQIYMGRFLLDKLKVGTWHTVLMNMTNGRVIGIIPNKYQQIFDMISAAIGNPWIAGIIMDCIKPWHYMFKSEEYVCGSYKVYAREHRDLC